MDLSRHSRSLLLALFAGLAMLAWTGCSPLLSLQPAPPPSPEGPPPTPRVGAPPEVPRPYYFPQRPIVLLVSYARGSDPAIAAQSVAYQLEKEVGQPVVVVNRTGGEGEEAWTQLKQAKPDGYTIGLIASPQIQAMALDPYRSVPFAMRDFVPLAGHLQDPGAVFVRAGSPFKGIEELVEAARAQPERIAVSVSATSLVDSLAAAEFQKRAGLKLRVIRFLDSTNALMAALAGQVEAEFGSFTRIAPSVKSRQGRFLAVLDERRPNDLPDVPTAKEKGIDVVSASSLGYVVPKGTSPEIVEYLAWALQAAISDPGHLDRMREAGLAVRSLNSQQYATFLSSQEARARQLLPEIR